MENLDLPNTKYFAVYTPEGNQIGTVKSNQNDKELIAFVDLLHDKDLTLKAITKQEFYAYDEGDELSADDLKEGNYLVINNDILKLINSRTFYRYYPSDSSPFRVSFENKNKYGFGIYFLDDPNYYSNQYPNGRLVAIKPDLKTPKIYHESAHHSIPNGNYMRDFIDYVRNNRHSHSRNDFNDNLLKEGYDSLVIYEPRGIYLVLLKEDSDLYTVLSDDKFKEGGTITPHPFVSASRKEAINDVITHKYKDLSEMEASILVNQFKDNKVPEHYDVSDWIWDMIDGQLYDKGYVEVTEIDSAGFPIYGLTEKGTNFLGAVEARFQSRYAVKHGTDLFPELSNIPEYEEEFKPVRENLSVLYDKLKRNEGLPDFFQQYEKQINFDSKFRFGMKEMSQQDFDSLINYFKSHKDKFKEDYAYILWQLDKYNGFDDGVSSYWHVGDDNKFHQEEGDDETFKSYAEVIKDFYGI